jgi:CheY-like chemotaxis protein
VALTFGYENNLKIDSDEEAMHGVDVEKAQKYPNVCVLADSSRLTQVIRNVISNALKFTKTGGCVEVTLILDSDTSEKQVKDSVKGKDGEEYGRVGTACVSVKDDGIGMTADQLGQLYGEGVQFDANKLQKGGGSGLGLWVSKGIVESHGGRICAESDGHEKGCIFTIHLPLVKSDHSMHHSYHHTSSSTVFDHSTNYAVFQGVPESAPEPRAYHMLVAEDSVPNRKMLVRLLERNGHTSDAAVDGEQAVEAVSATLVSSNNAQGELKPPFDVILMDYEMPNLNGPEATEQIRAIGYSGIVIGVTGNVLKEDVDFFKEKGANDVLSKPVRFADIQASLSKLKM